MKVMMKYPKKNLIDYFRVIYMILQKLLEMKKSIKNFATKNILVD